MEVEWWHKNKTITSIYSWETNEEKTGFFMEQISLCRGSTVPLKRWYKSYSLHWYSLIRLRTPGGILLMHWSYYILFLCTKFIVALSKEEFFLRKNLSVHLFRCSRIGKWSNENLLQYNIQRLRTNRSIWHVRKPWNLQIYTSLSFSPYITRLGSSNQPARTSV